MSGLPRDLALGVRIALGGGRASWTRLALTALGVGLGVAVLLVGASVPTLIQDRLTRTYSAKTPMANEPVAGADPLYRVSTPQYFGGDQIMGNYVVAGGPNAPVPPGLERIPGDGEVFLSPALAELLASPEGELLRPRIPQRVVGTIDKAGLVGPNHLRYIAGDASVERTNENAVHRFDLTSRPPTSAYVGQLGLIGLLLLLVPVLVFIVISTRLAAPERDRRLAALRLIGAGSRQVRRIAAGDALLGSVSGLAVGTALFLVLRAFAEHVEFQGIRVFSSDLTPVLLPAVLIALLVPVLSVVASLVAMRRTVVEPLGVVRQAEPTRRRLWWRVAPIALGAAMVATQAEVVVESTARRGNLVLLGGIALLLLGIPLLLPWLVERSASRMRGGPPSWQLAMRRLQMDSGTAARVVGGVAVVLAGGIALQTALAGAEDNIARRGVSERDNSSMVIQLSDTAGARTEELADLVRAAEGVDSVETSQSFAVRSRPDGGTFHVTVGSCATLRLTARLPECQDGDAFALNGYVDYDGRTVPKSGDVVLLDGLPSGGHWTLPAVDPVDPVDPVEPGSRLDPLMVTPGAIKGVDPAQFGSLAVRLDTSVPDAADHAPAAISPVGRRAHSSGFGIDYRVGLAADYRAMRQGLLAGALITVLLGGASLLVLALEQVRARRRPLAVLAAGGVPRRTIAWSLLWQNAVPLLLAVVVAVVTGAGLGLLLMRAMAVPLVLDLGAIGVLTAATAGVVLLVTVCTLPALHRASGALGLRAE